MVVLYWIVWLIELILGGLPLKIRIQCIIKTLKQVSKLITPVRKRAE